MWLAEWIRPSARERTIGLLRVRDNKLSFVEQIGQIDWELDLERVKQITAVNGGRALAIVSVAGEEYVVSILDPSLTHASPKRALAIIERAVESMAANTR
jgi:hypothetical protein